MLGALEVSPEMSSWSGRKVCEKTPGEGKGLDGPRLPQAGGMRGGVRETDLLPRRRKMEAESLVSLFIDSFGIWRETGARPGEVGAGEFIKNRPIDDLL